MCLTNYIKLLYLILCPKHFFFSFCLMPFHFITFLGFSCRQPKPEEIPDKYKPIRRRLHSQQPIKIFVTSGRGISVVVRLEQWSVPSSLCSCFMCEPRVIKTLHFITVISLAVWVREALLYCGAVQQMYSGSVVWWRVCSVLECDWSVQRALMARVLWAVRRSAAALLVTVNKPVAGAETFYSPARQRVDHHRWVQHTRAYHSYSALLY